MRRSRSSAFSDSDSDDSSSGRRSSVVPPALLHREVWHPELIGSSSSRPDLRSPSPPFTPFQGRPVPLLSGGTAGASVGCTGRGMASAELGSSASASGSGLPGAGHSLLSAARLTPSGAVSLPPHVAVTIGGVALLGGEPPPRRIVTVIGMGADGHRSPCPPSTPLAAPPPSPEADPSPQSLPRAGRASVSATGACNRAALVAEFFVPAKSRLGTSLRVRCPPQRDQSVRRAAPSLGADSHALELSSALAHRASHVAERLPPSATARILDRRSKGSSSQVSAPSRVRLVTAAIAESGGKDGSSLLPKLTTLANFADFAAAGGFPDAEGVSHSPIDIFSVQIGDALVAEYLRWERARGYVDDSTGLAPQALTNLRFARDHLGLDAPDLTSDLVVSAAQPSVDHAAGESVAQPKGSGSLPLRLIAGQEQLANARGGRGPEGLSSPAFISVCLRIIAFIFGLRGKEMRSARIEPDEDDIRYISLSFLPKGDTKKYRIRAWRWAFGVMGEFLWWPSVRSILLKLNTLEPNFQQPDRPGCAGNVLTALRLTSSGLAPKSSDAWLRVASLPHFGLSRALLTELGITKHSAHGTLSDVIGVFGGELGFDVVLDALAAGHWIASSGSTGAGGGGRSSDAAARRAGTDARAATAVAAAMPNRYRNGEHRGTPRVEGPRVVWSVLALSFYSISESGAALEDIDPSLGWSAPRAWALAHRGFDYPSEPPFSSPPFSSGAPSEPSARDGS